MFEVHQMLLGRSSICILENMNTGPLVLDKAYECMLLIGASRMTGGLQAIINPVAIR